MSAADTAAQFSDEVRKKFKRLAEQNAERDRLEAFVESYEQEARLLAERTDADEDDLVDYVRAAEVAALVTINSSRPDRYSHLFAAGQEVGK